MKIRRSTLLIYVSLLLTSIFVFSANANTKNMTHDLNQMDLILQQLSPLIDQAVKDQDPDAFVKFRFDILRHDIEKIRVGIAEAMLKRPVMPRNVSPLMGDYLEHSPEH